MPISNEAFGTTFSFSQKLGTTIAMKLKMPSGSLMVPDSMTELSDVIGMLVLSKVDSMVVAKLADR